MADLPLCIRILFKTYFAFKMIYKIPDWIIENNHKLSWGIIFVICNKYNLIEKYWEHFINYSNSSNINFNDDADILSYDTTIGYLSENLNSLKLISTFPTMHWDRLSSNPAAIRIIEQNIEKADFSRLSKNTTAIPLLEKYFEFIDWTTLSENPNAEKLLCSNIKYVNMYHLCSYNPNVVNIVNIMLENDPDNIHLLCWYSLSMNPIAVPLLEKYPEKVYWSVIVRNPKAFQLIKKNIDKIDDLGWEMLSRNPYASEFLKQYPYKVRMHQVYIDPSDLPIDQIDDNKESTNWGDLSFYSNDIEFLRKNIDNLDWHSLSMNPHIYTYDYDQMKANMDVLREELIKKAIHPDRVSKWIDLECEDMLE